MKINKKVLFFIRAYLCMLFCSLSYSLSTALFLAPNSIVAGGITGLSVLLNYMNNSLPIGLLTIALNLPILGLSLKFLGWKIVLKCLLTISVMGIITDLIAMFPPITNDPILASLYGGVCQGVAIGLLIKFEFSSGGTELLGRLIAKWTKVIKIPLCVGILDGIIVLFGTVVTKNINNMLYALIVIFVSTKVSEVMLVGLEKSKFCIIVTDKGREISDALIRRSPRGITMMEGEGMYTSRQHNVLMTCVKNRQLTQLKKIVGEVDPTAFIIINDSVEVRGKGFQALDKL